MSIDLYTETTLHKSVLVEEVLHYLQPQPEKLYLDATFGSGGHTRAILEHEPRCRVVALDWDAETLEKYAVPLQEEFGERFTYIWGSFGNLYRLLKKAKITSIDGALADFGTSQMQITARPGFSLHRDMPLDMRMSPAHHRITAAQVLATMSERELADIFFTLGEERYARKIAHAIVNDRKTDPLKTTTQLAALVKRVVEAQGSGSKGRRIHPATRVFQALRIYVNSELEHIDSFLKGVIPFLSPGARCVCISFHSLEDRLVKRFFRDREHEGEGRVLTKGVVMPSEEEVERNPSSRSARLRAFERV